MPRSSRPSRRFRRLSAAIAAVALVAGGVIAASPASASPDDNPNFSLVASVPGPVLSTPTVTITLTYHDKADSTGRRNTLM